MQILGKILFKGKELPFVEQITVFSEVQHIIGRYSFAAKFVEGKQVMEVACGSGYGGHLFMTKGAKSVNGGDLWEAAVRHAQITYQEHGLSYQILNATKLPFLDSTFDVIISIESIEHIVGYQDFIQECSRVLKNAQKEQTSFLLKNFVVTKDVQNFDIQDMATLVKPYFREASFYGQGVEPTYLGALNFKIQGFLKYVSYSYPAAGKIVGFCTRNNLMKMAHPMPLPPVEDFDKLLEEKFHVYPIIKGVKISPHTIFVVATK
jgi:ubiquinone/menaquinone biosynthesis C-methylase UbiE